MITILLTVLGGMLTGLSSTNQKGVPIHSQYDFAYLDKIAPHVRVIGIGESTHGNGAFYQLKTEMVQYLHEQHGFNVLAMEGGLADIGLAWSQCDSLDGAELRDQTLFGNFRCKEILPLFEYLISAKNNSRPLNYAGYDCQTSSRYFSKIIKKVLQSLQPSLLPVYEQGQSAYYKIFPAVAQGDSLVFVTQRDLFLDNARQVQTYLLTNIESVQQHLSYQDFQTQLLLRGLEMLIRSQDIDWNIRFDQEGNYRGILLRDELMYENLVWLLDSIYPQQKFIVWAHNGHIQKSSPNNSSAKWLGTYLKEKLRDQYYAIGLFAYAGEAYQFWTRDTIKVHNNDPNSIETKMHQPSASSVFIDLNQPHVQDRIPWSHQTLQANELENGGMVRFIPAERFDGVLTIAKSWVPTF